MGMKAKASHFRGIDFVRLRDLPKDQLTLLKSTPHRPEIVNILIHNNIAEPCILYHDYAHWLSMIKQQNLSSNTSKL